MWPKSQPELPKQHAWDAKGKKPVGILFFLFRLFTECVIGWKLVKPRQTMSRQSYCADPHMSFASSNSENQALYVYIYIYIYRIYIYIYIYIISKKRYIYIYTYIYIYICVCIYIYIYLEDSQRDGQGRSIAQPAPRDPWRVLLSGLGFRV